MNNDYTYLQNILHPEDLEEMSNIIHDALFSTCDERRSDAIKDLRNTGQPFRFTSVESIDGQLLARVQSVERAHTLYIGEVRLEEKYYHPAPRVLDLSY